MTGVQTCALPILILFQNGEQKIFDVKPLLNSPLYQPLQNKMLFHCAKADGMCVYWNDDIDICPDMLYTDSRSLNLHDRTTLINFVFEMQDKAAKA